LLLNAVRALEWFICRETKEEPMAHVVELAATPATEKAAAPDAAQTPAPAPADPGQAPSTETPPVTAEKAATGGAEENDLTELVKALTAKVDRLDGELTKAMNAASPGGPVLTRTTGDTAKADHREKHLTDAAHWARLADEVRDPVARAGFLQKAATARAAATS
jgi:hypothetical protein